jgi:hypothetical protein
MSYAQLTPNEFLRLNKDQVEGIFEETLPQSKGKPFFVPSLYNAVTDPMLTQIKKWKAESTAKAAERKAILNWVIPMLFIGPGLISIILAGGWAKHTSIVITTGAVLIISYLWFFGRIWAWERKKYEANVAHAESAFTRITDKRAREWAESRYDMNTDHVEWNEFSNFYIEGKGYRWKETGEEGQFILVESETDEEVPLLNA